MKSGFKDRTEVKGKSIKNPYDFVTPVYDQRSSCFMRAGDDYGTGINQPVGHKGEPKKEGVPMGRVNTMSIHDAKSNMIESM